MSKNILIAGAGIAGACAAWWLARAGYKVTIIEKAPSLRTGGYSVDIRGKAVEVIDRMGLKEKVKAKSSDITTAVFVDEHDNELVALPSDLIEMQNEGDLELIRGELLTLLYEATKDICTYLFNTSIAHIEETTYGVKVSFSNKQPDAYFDLVIGADGMHSQVRKMLFGDEAQFSYSYGNYFFAFFSADNFNMGNTEKFFSAPNKTINLYTPQNESTTRVLFIFKDDTFNLKLNARENMIQMFSVLKWKVPELLQGVQKSHDLYIDHIKQIRMDKWHRGNIVLVGDAAYAPSLATGQGTSMAIVGAYVLAQEIIQANDISRIAFPKYRERLRNYVTHNQKLGKNIKNMTAKNETVLKMQIRFLKLLKRWPFLSNMMKKGMAKAANAVEL